MSVSSGNNQDQSSLQHHDADHGSHHVTYLAMQIMMHHHDADHDPDLQALQIMSVIRVTIGIRLLSGTPLRLIQKISDSGDMTLKRSQYYSRASA